MPVLVQVPPACSPVMRENKSIGVVLESQIVVLPSVPAFTAGLTTMVPETDGFEQPPAVVSV